MFRREEFYNHEKEIIEEVERRLPDEFSGTSGFEKLIKMQHYGAPTRMLDLTGNPLVALYFACSNDESCDGNVFVENMPIFSLTDPLIDKFKYLINRYSFIKSEEELLLGKEHAVVTIKSAISNQRLRNQDGYFSMFTYTGEYRKFTWSPLDTESPFYLADIIIPKEKKKSLLKALSLCGIKKSFLFPELQYQIENIVEDIVYGENKKIHLVWDGEDENL